MAKRYEYQRIRNMKILFFIGTLNTGGAERQMTQLAKGLSNRGHKTTVVTVFPGGQYSEFIQKIPEIKLFSLWPKRGNFYSVRVYQILYSPIKLIEYTKKTDLCYSMLEISNLIAWIASRFSGNVNVVWGIRASIMRETWKMALFNKLCAIVSPTVRLVIVNSRKGLENIIKYGYRPKKVQVIYNGIDVEEFQYDKNVRKNNRQELKILDHQPVVGIVGRIIPIKDHPSFIKAVSLVSEKIKDVKILIVGEGQADYLNDLHILVEKLGLDDSVIWLSNRVDIVEIYNAMDVLVSSSLSEGFPNVIGEAMACGVPCIVTDVGDSARIVDDPTRVVRPGDPEMLAAAIIRALRIEKGGKESKAIREKIVNSYSINNLIELTEQALTENT